MKIRSFDWDNHNTEHIASHGVDCDEVEQVFLGEHRLFRSRQGRYTALGHSAQGRHLFVVFDYLGHGAVRVITARDMTPRERKLLRKYL